MQTAKRLVLISILGTFLLSAYVNCGQSFEAASRSVGIASLVDPTVVLNFASLEPDVINATDTSVAFTVQSSGNQFTLKCYLNSAAMQTCASPLDLSDAPEGNLPLRITAENANGQVLAQIDQVVKVDRTGPLFASEVTATNIVFSVNDNFTAAANLTIKCALDAATEFTACTSPYAFTGISAGAHTLKLQSTDQAGNVATSNAIAFTIKPATAGAFTHVACVGDSITAGYGVSGDKSYPTQLQTLFGASVKVGNFGRSGATLHDSGDMPYTQQSEFNQGTDFVKNAGANANVAVVIMLGTNDSKSGNWNKIMPTQIMAALVYLVDHYAKLSTHPKVFVAYPADAFCGLNPSPCASASFGINGVTIHNEIVPAYKAVATSLKYPTIDINAQLNDPTLFPDGVHPSDQGYKKLADLIHKGLTNP